MTSKTTINRPLKRPRHEELNDEKDSLFKEKNKSQTKFLVMDPTSTPPSMHPLPVSDSSTPALAVSSTTIPPTTYESLKELIENVQGPYAYISSVFNEFHSELLVKDTEPFQGNDKYFWFIEMKLLLTTLYQACLMELAHISTKPDTLSTMKNSNNEDADTPTQVDSYPSSILDPIHTQFRISNRSEMTIRLNIIASILTYVRQVEQKRIERTKQLKLPLPRIFDLSKHYQLTPKEVELFQVLVVFQGCQSNTLRCHILEEDTQRKMMSCQRLASLSAIELEEFYDDTREHVREGTLMVDEEHFGSSIRLSNICIHVLLGHKLTHNQWLKLSQTALEKILHDEGIFSSIDTENGKKAEKEKSEEDEDDNTLTDNHKEIQSGTESHLEKPEDEEEDGNSSESDEMAFNYINKHDSMKEKASCKLGSGSPNATSMVSSLSSNNKKLTPYQPDNQLDYLEDRFQVIAFAIRASGARVKDQMKEAGTKQPWETSAPPTAGRRELKAKQRVKEMEVTHRLELTRRAKFSLPRLEAMASKFHLNTFEQNVVVMLIGKTISPVIKNLIDGVDTSPVQRMDESTTINQVLSVFCDTFQEQVAHRIYFYKSSRLLSRGIVKVFRGRWHSTSGDLVDQRIELDRRVLDWVVGLDTEINELVEGSDLYVPKVELDQVVLPEEHKSTILQTVESYEAFRTYRKKSGFGDNTSFTYGAGLVILLCGASGTGKTMTVNAIAHHLNKRVLLVDFPSLQGKRREGTECDADLRGLFREADMSNAILFFDECESIFKQREFGGDRLLNALLSEMERYEGIVFLATNRPFDLDEAMHRRITSVFEFKAPDHIQRKKIWERLTMKHFNLSECIDWDSISLKYELSGGFIKNALLSALLKALSRDAENPQITQEDIVMGCRLQMRGSLHMKTFDHRVIPSTGLEDLILESDTKATIQQVIEFEKARHVIYGQWGFDFGETKSKQKGITVLLWGPSGVGKKSAAKAIGFEVGRPLKLVHFSQMQHDTIAETHKTMRSIFDDARLMDAVLVLDGFETFGCHLSTAMHDSVADSPRFQVESKFLLDMMDSFPGIVVLLASQDRSLSSNLLHASFSKRLKFLIELKSPNAVLRTKIWKNLFPTDAPLASDINFKKLGERFSLNNDSISNAIFRAAATAALRPESDREIRMKDLMDAAEVEKKKASGGDAALMMNRLFA